MNPLLRIVRRQEILELAARMRAAEVISVLAPEAEEAIAVTRVAMEQMPSDVRLGTVDVNRCATAGDFVLAFVRAVAGIHLTDPTWLDLPDAMRPAPVRAGLVEFGERGGELLRTLEAPEPLDEHGRERAFALAVDALTRRTATTGPAVLAFLGAEDIAALAGVESLLWTLRGRLQHATARPAVVLAGGNAAGDVSDAPTTALFGWSTTLALVESPALREALRSRLALDGLETATDTLAARIVEGSQGSLVLAEQLAALTVTWAKAGSESAYEQAYIQLVDLHAPRLRRMVALARTIDNQALPVLSALAEDRPPYSIDSHPSGASRALAKLRSAGLVVQSRPRAWKIVDPLLRAWLRGPAAQGRYAFGRPAVFVVRRAAHEWQVVDGPSMANLRSTHTTREQAEVAASAITSPDGRVDLFVCDEEDPRDLPGWVSLTD